MRLRSVIIMVGDAEGGHQKLDRPLRLPRVHRCECLVGDIGEGTVANTLEIFLRLGDVAGRKCLDRELNMELVDET